MRLTAIVLALLIASSLTSDGEELYLGPWRQVDFPAARAILRAFRIRPEIRDIHACGGSAYMRPAISAPEDDKYLLFCYGYIGPASYIPRPDLEKWVAFFIFTNSNRVEGPFSLDKFPNIPLPQGSAHHPDPRKNPPPPE